MKQAAETELELVETELDQVKAILSEESAMRFVAFSSACKKNVLDTETPDFRNPPRLSPRIRRVAKKSFETFETLKYFADNRHKRF